jgi:iron complex transport system permease protein
LGFHRAVGATSSTGLCRMRAALPFVLLPLLALSALLGLAVGSTSVPWGDVVAALWSDDGSLSARIVREVRLPAIVLALGAGALLGAAGAVVQGLLRNPLADPYLLGVSGGAGLGTAVSVAAGVPPWLGSGGHLLAAVVGAGLAVALIERIGSAFGTRASGPHTLLLAGVILNAFAGALLLVTHLFVDPARSQQLLFLLMGNVDPSRVSAAQTTIALSVGGLAVAGSWLAGPLLDALTFGDEHARAIGLHPIRSRRLLLGLLALLTGSAVALAGLLGFVGLVVPHLVRPLTGARHRDVILGSTLAGACFVVLADAVSRSAFAALGTSLPTGAVTALAGAPFFLALLVFSTRRAPQ